MLNNQSYIDRSGRLALSAQIRNKTTGITMDMQIYTADRAWQHLGIENIKIIR